MSQSLIYVKHQARPLELTQEGDDTTLRGLKEIWEMWLTNVPEMLSAQCRVTETTVLDVECAHLTPQPSGPKAELPEGLLHLSL